MSYLKVSIFLIIGFLLSCASSQSLPNHLITTINGIDSKDWKEDSTACLGTRYQQYQTLTIELNKLIYQITKKEVIDIIGHPNVVRKIGKAIYHYYYIVGQQGCIPQYYTDASFIYMAYNKNGKLYYVNVLGGAIAPITPK